MGKYIKIKNWIRWQSYRKDRGQPPWIKLHRCLFRNYEWCTLSDAEKGQLVMIWMLAADNDGKIPTEPQKVKLLCGMDSLPDFNMFGDKGFLDYDANVTPERRQRDANVTPSETPVVDNFSSDVCKPVEMGTLPDYGANVTPQRQKQKQIRLEAEQRRQSERARDNPETSKQQEPPNPANGERGTPGQAMDMALLLESLLLKNDPCRKTPRNLEPWIIRLQQLHETGRHWTEIEEIIRWSQADDFWLANIGDARSLCAKFSKMRLQSKRSEKGNKHEPVSAKNMRLLSKCALAADKQKNRIEVNP